MRFAVVVGIHPDIFHAALPYRRPACSYSAARPPSTGARLFNLWANGCAHVIHDKSYGRESLADALRQSERGDGRGAPPFDWDVCVNVGDYSAAFGPPNDEEGAEIVRQFGALRDHRREQIYSVCGNHDRDPLDAPEGSWFRKWIDPMGENPATSGANRDGYRYPVHGTWERYWFDVGNIRFPMMSDVNERSQPLGRGPLGGNPGGVVTSETFDWWVDMVERSRNDRIVVTVHHYVLKETTVASGEWEGRRPQGRSHDGATGQAGRAIRPREE
ncbi:MAG: metallophosphoesterase, partial [Rhodospirillales bacterium]|nr:metallophosphoesterase [Rhodospirillales bacterium]